MAPPEFCSVLRVQLYMSALATSGNLPYRRALSILGHFLGRAFWECVCKMMCRNIPFVPSDARRRKEEETNMRGTLRICLVVD